MREILVCNHRDSRYREIFMYLGVLVFLSLSLLRVFNGNIIFLNLMPYLLKHICNSLYIHEPGSRHAFNYVCGFRRIHEEDVSRLWSIRRMFALAQIGFKERFNIAFILNPRVANSIPTVTLLNPRIILRVYGSGRRHVLSRHLFQCSRREWNVS